MTVKSRPRLLCGQPVPGMPVPRPCQGPCVDGAARAPGHLWPGCYTRFPSPGSAPGNQRRNHFMALQIWKNKKISARKNVRFGDGDRTGWGPFGTACPGHEAREGLMLGSPVRAQHPPCSIGVLRGRLGHRPRPGCGRSARPPPSWCSAQGVLDLCFPLV